MASAISYEFYDSKLGVADGVATLDGTGKVPLSQLPTAAVETFKGTFATSADLISAFPLGATGDYAYVTATKSYWYWNNALTTPAWANQEITETDYNLLTADERTGMPYIIVV